MAFVDKDEEAFFKLDDSHLKFHYLPLPKTVVHGPQADASLSQEKRDGEEVNRVPKRSDLPLTFAHVFRIDNFLSEEECQYGPLIREISLVITLALFIITCSASCWEDGLVCVASRCPFCGDFQIYCLLSSSGFSFVLANTKVSIRWTRNTLSATETTAACLSNRTPCLERCGTAFCMHPHYLLFPLSDENAS